MDGMAKQEDKNKVNDTLNNKDKDKGKTPVRKRTTTYGELINNIHEAIMNNKSEDEAEPNDKKSNDIEKDLSFRRLVIEEENHLIDQDINEKNNALNDLVKNRETDLESTKRKMKMDNDAFNTLKMNCETVRIIKMSVIEGNQKNAERIACVDGLKYELKQLNSRKKKLEKDVPNALKKSEAKEKELSKYHEHAVKKGIDTIREKEIRNEVTFWIDQHYRLEEELNLTNKKIASNEEQISKISEKIYCWKVTQKARTDSCNILLKNKSEWDFYNNYIKFQSEKEGMEKEIAQLAKTKENVENQVMDADWSSISVHTSNGDNSEDTTKGLSVNGRFYGRKKDNTIATNANLDDMQMKRAIEKQKIINAIKSKEIFKQVNKKQIVRYLKYDDAKGQFDKETVAPPIEEYTGYLLMLKGLGDGLENIGKFILKAGLGFLASFTGIEKFIDIRRSASANDASVSASTAFNAATGALTLTSVSSLGLDFLDMLTNVQEKAGLVINHLNNWTFGTGKPVAWGIGPFKVLADSSLSVAGGISYLMTLISDGVTASTSAIDKYQLGKAEKAQANRGNKGYSRILGNAKIEKKISEVNSYIDIVKTALSTTLALTGFGGLLAPVISIGGGILAQAIAGGILSRKRKKEVLNSPDILGGIEYQHNIVNEDMFNDILFKETGIKDTDSLYDSIRIIDSIDLHSNVKKAIANNKVDRDTDMTMTALGYSDISKYPKVKLTDIQKKMGYTQDWRQDLQHAIEKRGIDYDTSFSKFVRGYKGDSYYLEKDARRMLSEGLISKEECDKIIESAKKQAENNALGVNLVPKGAT